MPAPLPLPDTHVHTEWSWDAARGSMERSCERALELGLPGIAFTDHADFVEVFEKQHPLDVGGYLECVERCRAAYPGLRILSGVELGEPHLYPDLTAAVLAAGPLDRVLGSVHCVVSDGANHDLSQSLPGADRPAELVTAYFADLLAMVRSPQPFEVLAHLDYCKRYWPAGREPYRAADFEEEIRAVLREAASRGCVLEVNTTRGMDPERGLCPGPQEVRWWYEAGGREVSFGSDAHSPDRVGEGFALARAAVEAAGFRPAADPLDHWRR